MPTSCAHSSATRRAEEWMCSASRSSSAPCLSAARMVTLDATSPRALTNGSSALGAAVFERRWRSRHLLISPDTSIESIQRLDVHVSCFLQLGFCGCCWCCSDDDSPLLPRAPSAAAEDARASSSSSAHASSSSAASSASAAASAAAASSADASSPLPACPSRRSLAARLCCRAVVTAASISCAAETGSGSRLAAADPSAQSSERSRPSSARLCCSSSPISLSSCAIRFDLRLLSARRCSTCSLLAACAR